jgi:hypothetical protein
MTRLGLPALCLVLGAGGASAQEAPPDTLALARQYTTWLYFGAADSLVAHSSARAREGFATVTGFGERTAMILERAGMEVDVLEETWKLRNGNCQYWRTANFSGMDEPLLVRWVLNERGEIEGLGLGPAMAAPQVEAEHCGKN